MHMHIYKYMYLLICICIYSDTLVVKEEKLMNFRGNGWNIECVKEESGKGRSYLVLKYKTLRKLKRGT